MTAVGGHRRRPADRPLMPRGGRSFAPARRSPKFEPGESCELFKVALSRAAAGPGRAGGPHGPAVDSCSCRAAPLLEPLNGPCARPAGTPQPLAPLLIRLDMKSTRISRLITGKTSGVDGACCVTENRAALCCCFFPWFRSIEI